MQEDFQLVEQSCISQAHWTWAFELLVLDKEFKPFLSILQAVRKLARILLAYIWFFLSFFFFGKF